MIRFTRRGEFRHNYDDLISEMPELIPIIEQKVKWFLHNPSDTRLVNHPLRKSMEGKWAFSITDDIRIVYEWVGKSTVRFLAIGPHTKVYKSPNAKEKN